MTARLEALRDMVQGALRNPAADLSTTALLLVGVSLLGLILVVVLLLLATPRQRKVMKIRVKRAPAAEDEQDAGGERDDTAEAAVVAPVDARGDADEVRTNAATEEVDGQEAVDASEPFESARVVRRKTPVEAILGLLLSVPVLVVLAVASGYVVTGTDTVCAGACHATQPTAVEAHERAHASCSSCHEKPGLAGVPVNVVSRASMVAAWASGKRTAGSAIVDSSSCISCHSVVLDGVTKGTTGVRMSHREPLDSGMTCASCHGRTGHDAGAPYSMSSCLPCHDDRKASAECKTCHTSDPYEPKSATGETSATALGSGRMVYPVVKVRNTDCGGCHDQERQCDTCHGLRMPHPASFVARDHARMAAFEKKQACYKCHTPDSCNSRCHIGFPGHGNNWKQSHQRMPKDAVCGCHAARTGRTEPMCVLCHDF